MYFVKVYQFTFLKVNYTYMHKCEKLKFYLLFIHDFIGSKTGEAGEFPPSFQTNLQIYLIFPFRHLGRNFPLKERVSQDYSWII